MLMDLSVNNICKKSKRAINDKNSQKNKDSKDGIYYNKSEF